MNVIVPDVPLDNKIKPLCLEGFFVLNIFIIYEKD